MDAHNSEFDKIFKEVPPTSFVEPKPAPARPIEEIYNDLITTLNLNIDETNKFKEGIGLERFKKTIILRMMLEIIVSIIDNSQKIQTGDKADDALYLQNKKIVRDIAFSLFTLLNNYNFNDREVKIMILGKLLQSLHGNR